MNCSCDCNFLGDLQSVDDSHFLHPLQNAIQKRKNLQMFPTVFWYYAIATWINNLGTLCLPDEADCFSFRDDLVLVAAHYILAYCTYVLVDDYVDSVH